MDHGAIAFNNVHFVACRKSQDTPKGPEEIRFCDVASLVGWMHQGTMFCVCGPPPSTWSLIPGVTFRVSFFIFGMQVHSHS